MLLHSPWSCTLLGPCSSATAYFSDVKPLFHLWPIFFLSFSGHSLRSERTPVGYFFVALEVDRVRMPLLYLQLLALTSRVLPRFPLRRMCAFSMCAVCSTAYRTCVRVDLCETASVCFASCCAAIHGCCLCSGSALFWSVVWGRVVCLYRVFSVHFFPSVHAPHSLRHCRGSLILVTRSHCVGVAASPPKDLHTQRPASFSVGH